MTTIRLEVLEILEQSTRGWLYNKQRRSLLYNMVFFQNINLAFEADGRTKVVCYGFYLTSNLSGSVRDEAIFVKLNLLCLHMLNRKIVSCS